MILMDSSVIIAAIVEKESNHERARGLMEEVRRDVWGKALVPDYVLLEVASALQRRRGFEASAAFVRAVSEAVDGRIVPCFEVLQRATQLYLAQRRGPLSLVDCAIAALAEAHHIPNIATFDAGFRAVPGLNIIDGPRAA